MGAGTRGGGGEGEEGGGANVTPIVDKLLKKMKQIWNRKHNLQP